jgi:glycosyltransferase involved in cell wall biosynthesis
MNVMHTIPSLIPESGGPARSVTGLCTALARVQNEVHLLSLDVGNRYSKPITPIASLVKTTFVPNLLAIGLRQLWAPQFRNTLQELVRRESIELIHDHCIWLPTNMAVTAVARRSKVPFVVSLRGMLEPWAMQYSRHKKQIMWHLYQRRNLEAATLLHATAESEAVHLRQLGLRKPIAIIPNGVDLPEQTKRKPKEASQPQTILFLSRIHPKKGLFNLIEALRQLPMTGWQVLIAGPDEQGHQAEVAAAAGSAGLQHIVHFVGPVDDDDKWDLYRSADLFVLPTYSENFGIVIAEALASGVPVITTTGTPWQELRTHQCGWWIEPKVEPLRAAIREAFALSDEQRVEMGQRGRNLVESKYSWAAIAAQMSAVYQWILGRGSLPKSVIL